MPATRTEIEKVLRCTASNSVPPFLPAIYEHKAWFLGATPSTVARDADLLARAVLAEYEAVQADALTIGVDIYNIEAEACGAKVTFYEGKDSSIPGIKPGDHLFHVGDDLSMARVPNPLSDGRMPVNLRAARLVRSAVGDNVWLRGALTGPFSLAVSLVGADDLFMACLDDPQWVHSCLAYCSRVIRCYAQAFLDAGVELVLFDSQASPSLLSPPMFEEFVAPVLKELRIWAASQGLRDLPLIIGGNTTSIAKMLCDTGANNLLCDFTADLHEWTSVVRAEGRAFRRNVSPSLLEKANPEKIYETVSAELKACQDIPGFIMGTAVIPYGTPTAKILAVKQACLDARPSSRN